MGVLNFFCWIVGVVLFYDGDLWFIVGGIWFVDFIILFDIIVGVYWCVCFYDVCYFFFWLCFVGGKYVSLVVKFDVD